MAKDKKGFILYADQIDIFNTLSDELAGKLIKHIYRYVNDENPESSSPMLNLAFATIKSQLKRDLKKYEKTCSVNKENALKRWNKKNATACERIPPDANHADIDNDIDKDTDSNTAELENDFSKVWELYGKKTYLMDAQNEYYNLTLEEREIILHHIPKFIKNHNKADKIKFLPKFSNYLIDKRWLEDLPYDEKTKMVF